MEFVDYGIIVRTEEPWIYVKPRCQHCGYLEQSDWNLAVMSPPRMKDTWVYMPSV